MAIYEKWLPETALVRMANHAKLNIENSNNVSASTAGPAAGCLATARWLPMIDAKMLTTDEGRTLGL